LGDATAPTKLTVTDYGTELSANLNGHVMSWLPLAHPAAPGPYQVAHETWMARGPLAPKRVVPMRTERHRTPAAGRCSMRVTPDGRLAHHGRSGATSDGHVPTRTVRGRVPSAEYGRPVAQPPRSHATRIRQFWRVTSRPVGRPLLAVLGRVAAALRRRLCRSWSSG
jgi:hypothetical protein